MNNFDCTESLIESLIRLWHETDHEIPLYEFLRLTPQEYKDYVEGRLNDGQVEAIYLGKPYRKWEWLPLDGKHDLEE